MKVESVWAFWALQSVDPTLSSSSVVPWEKKQRKKEVSWCGPCCRRTLYKRLVRKEGSFRRNNARISQYLTSGASLMFFLTWKGLKVVERLPTSSSTFSSSERVFPRISSHRRTEGHFAPFRGEFRRIFDFPRGVTAFVSPTALSEASTDHRQKQSKGTTDSNQTNPPRKGRQTQSGNRSFFLLGREIGEIRARAIRF